MTIINKHLINYILINKRLNEHFGQISIDFWSLEITEIKFEIRNQLKIKLISKSRTRFQQVSDPSTKSTSLNQARAALNQSIDHVFVVITPTTVEGAKTSFICEPDQTLFPPTQRKTEKSGLAT